MSPEAIVLMSASWAAILGVTIFCLWRICAEQASARRLIEQLPDLKSDKEQ
ncbi:MAG: hypothetical protein ACYC7E_18980 [Armatimonadota bacterium]